MVLSMQIPEQASGALREAYGENLNRAAIEAIAIEGYRSGKLSRRAVQLLLGFDNTWDAESWLGSHCAHLAYSSGDLDEDRQTLDRILGPVAPPC